MRAQSLPNDPARWVPRESSRVQWLLIGCVILAMLIGAASQVLNPSPGLAWVTTAGIPAIVVAALLVARDGRRAVLALVCVLLYLEAVLTASLFVLGIAFAILVPIIGIGLVQPHVRGPAALAAYVAAGVVATVSVALVELSLPPTVGDHESLPTIAAFGLVAACTLGLLWRAGQRQVEALEAADRELAARTHTERELSDTARLLQTLITSSPVPTMAFDVSGAVSVWNPAAQGLFGWSADEVLGWRLPPKIRPRGGRADLREHVDRTLRGEAIRGEQLRARRKDGREVVVEVYADVRHDDAARPVGVIVQAIDVTERARLEAQVQQAQKMEAVSHLAGGVAHDINNTLTAVGGFAELIEAETTDREVKDDARTISDAVSRARGLTRQLLAFARRSVLQPEVINLDAFVTSVRPLIERLLDPRIELRIEHASPPVAVSVDPGQFEQVLLNLAINARDAMPQGGTLTIRTGRAAPSAGESEEPAGGSATVTVSDTGTGIAPEVQDHVFEPFFTTKPRELGSGLGLAMVYGFVTQSGGTVELRSTPGVGTAVEIRLPEATEEPHPSPASPAVPARSSTRETVLLVDDEQVLAKLGERILEGLGYQVISATDGSMAIELARAYGGPIDLILSDVIMPGLSGPEVVEAIRRLHPEAAVLYASGYTADAISDRRGLPEGVEMIEKPFTATELAARVRTVLDARG